MCSSSNPFPHPPFFSPSNCFFDHEKDNVDFHNSFLSGDFNNLNSYNISHVKEFVMDQQQLSEGSYSEDHDDLLDSVIIPYKKKMAASKKDGHSKIYTAQGPRDRRVRLSIEVARKFFCLQELLGFDKASKTLDWLLGKSLTAIKDLVEHTSSSTVTEESKLKFLETIENNNNGKKKKKAVVVKCSSVEPKKKKKISTQRCKLVENVSRTEARARARERTKEKMRVKNLDWGQQNEYDLDLD